MRDFTLYEAESGRILSAGMCDHRSWDGQPEPKLEAPSDPDRDYVVEGAVVPRPEIGEVVPAATDVVVEHETEGVVLDGVTEADEALAFEWPIPGRYTVRLTPPFPYLATAYTVDAE